MKIAFVISTFPPKIGGMGEICYQEAKNLAMLGHSVTVFTLLYPGLSLESDKNLPFKVVRLFTPVILGDAGLAPQLLFRLSDFDIIHLHYPFYGGGFLVFLAHFIWRIPYVVTYHMDAQPAGFLKKIIKYVSDSFLAKVILRQAQKVIIVDAKNQQQFAFLKNMPPNHLVEISNAIDTKIFYHLDISREKLGYKNFNNKKILLFVGNLLAVKRLDLILLALKKINDPSFVLLVVGDGYDSEKYQNLAVELGLSNQVVFLGEILDKNLLAQYYSVADVTVIPSDYESFSLVALESLACSTPLIVSKIEGLLGRVSEGVDGLFFLPGNSADLSQKIIQFFKYPEAQRRQMGQSGYEKVATDYSWPKHIQDLLRVYLNN